MKKKKLIWRAHGMEMSDAIQALEYAEWSREDDFMDIVDTETSTLMA